MLIANKRKEIDWYNLRKTVEACAAEAQKSRLFESLFSVCPSDIQINSNILAMGNQRKEKETNS